MATIRILLGIICFVITSSRGYAGGHLLVKQKDQRQEIVRLAQAELGVREYTGKNDGKRVEEYLQVVNMKKGNPWCAAFVSWVFAQAGFKQPRTAWSPALFHAQVLTKKVAIGNVFGIFFKSLHRVAHVGIVVKQEGNWVVGIEGNTNSVGSREGDGVYQKRRHLKTIYAYADWVGRKGAQP